MAKAWQHDETSANGLDAETQASGIAVERSWPSGQAVVALSRKVLVDHYERRDIDALMRPMADDLTWIGPLENQHAHAAADMRAIIEPEYGIRVRLVDEQWGMRAVSGARVVVARYGLVADGTEVEDVIFRQAATFVWALSPSGPCVVHLHLSNAYDVPPRVDAPFVPGEDGIAYTIDAVSPPPPVRVRIRFETPDGHVRFVSEDRILSLRAEGRGIAVAHDEGLLTADGSLSQVEGRLPSWFVRTHRGCIVNARRAVALRRFAVAMDDGSECPVAERRYLEVAEALEAAAERPLRDL